MYVKVHKIGNQWFRSDNGTLVGIEVSTNTRCYKNIYKYLCKPIIIVKNVNNELKQIHYGYFYNNKFTKLDISQKCLDKTCGYYAFVLD